MKAREAEGKEVECLGYLGNPEPLKDLELLTPEPKSLNPKPLNPYKTPKPLNPEPPKP